MADVSGGALIAGIEAGGGPALAQITDLPVGAGQDAFGRV